jgi:hypothetical protein
MEYLYNLVLLLASCFLSSVGRTGDGQCDRGLSPRTLCGLAHYMQY